MEIFTRYLLPCDFKPVANLCNEMEKNLFIELKCLTKINDKLHKNVVANLPKDEHDIVDDVEFIVRMQHENDIAIETPEEIAEWYYTLSVMRSIEHYKTCAQEYDKYTEDLTKRATKPAQTKLLAKIVNIKKVILTMYHHYIYDVSYNSIERLIKSITDNGFLDIETDFKWTCQFPNTKCPYCQTQIPEPEPDLEKSRKEKLSEKITNLVDQMINIISNAQQKNQS